MRLSAVILGITPPVPRLHSNVAPMPKGCTILSHTTITGLDIGAPTNSVEGMAVEVFSFPLFIAIVVPLT